MQQIRNHILGTTWHVALAIAVCVTAFYAQPAASQAPATEPAPHTSTITVNARLVVLDVVVTDKAGKPVSGLTRDDFQVFEDKQPQKIRSFEPPSTHVLPSTSANAGASQVFDAADPASFGQSPVTVLVLDQLNTHFADSSFARRSLIDYLQKQPQPLAQPTTLLTVYDQNFKLLQGFTRDRDLLLKTLNAAPTKNAWQLEVNGNAEYGPIERLSQSLRALEQIAQSFARIPGRKNLIWVGGGFPSLDPSELDGDEDKEVKDTLQHITDVLLYTRITLYAVDPTSLAPGMTEITDTTQLEMAEAGGNDIAGAFDPYNSAEDFDRLGPVTGGRVVRGRNDVAEQIASAIDLGAQFYTIGYSPTSTSELAGKYRQIRVVCPRPGLTATTRDGYYPAETQEQKSNNTVAYDLTTAAESTIPLNGLHVTVEKNHSVSSEEEAYIIHVGASSLTWKPEDDGTSTAHVAIMGVSLSSKSKMIGHTLHAATAHARAGTDLRDTTKTADFNFTVKPVARTTQLRFIVRDAGTGRMGSVDIPLPTH